MKTAVKNEKLKAVRQNLKSARTRSALLNAAYFAAALVLAQGRALGGVSPLAVSLITAASGKNYYAAALGGAIGYLIFAPQDFPRCAAAVLLALLGTLALDLASARENIFLPAGLSFLCVFATGIVADIKTGGTAQDMALTAAQSILGAGGAFFFTRALGCTPRRLRSRALPASDLACLAAAAALLFMSLSSLEIGGFSPARCAAALAVLLTVRFGSDKMGIMLALCCGFAFSLAGNGEVFLTGAYGFCALTACLFCSYGAAACVFSFALSFALFTTAAGAGAMYFFEAAAACLLSLACPRVIEDKIRDYFRTGQSASPDGSLRQSLVMRLRVAESAVEQISRNVSEVSERIAALGGCGVRDEKANEMRLVAADQFGSVAGMLGDLAREFDEAEYFDSVSAERVRQSLAERGIFPKSVCVTEDKYGRVRAQILAPGRETGFDDAAQQEISKACRRCLEKSSVSYNGGETCVCFTERTAYSLEVGFAQHSAEGPLCGDALRTVNDTHGRSVLIISDGMGQGGRAAIEGAMGAGLLSRLLSSGFGFDSALKIVNSALLVKSADECLATLDCAAVDLFTGHVELYKAGAPATYIVKGKRITKCELSSLPAGILRNIEFAKRTAALDDGDLIIMTSDGVGSAEWLGELICEKKDEGVQQLADDILSRALEAARGTREDDISVIAARLKRRENDF